jgi:hypothetical protein
MQLRARRRSVEPSPAQPVESAFDPDCFDFTAYLSRRLGVDVDLTTEVLGQWLKAYERSDRSSGRRETAPSDPDFRHPSGVYSLQEGDEQVTERTGTFD